MLLLRCPSGIACRRSVIAFLASSLVMELARKNPSRQVRSGGRDLKTGRVIKVGEE